MSIDYTEDKYPSELESLPTPLQDDDVFVVDRGTDVYKTSLSEVRQAMEYEFTQSSPSQTWTINHNLGRNPIVTLYSIGGVEIDAAIIHTTVNQCIVSFVIPYAGSARLI